MMQERYVETTVDIYNERGSVREVGKDLRKINQAYCSVNPLMKMEVINEIYQSYPWMNGAIALIQEVASREDTIQPEEYEYILGVQHRVLYAFGCGKEIRCIMKEEELYR